MKLPNELSGLFFEHTDYLDDHTSTHWAIETENMPKLLAYIQRENPMTCPTCGSPSPMLSPKTNGCSDKFHLQAFEPSGDDTLTEILTDLAFVSDGISDEALETARTQLLQYIEGEKQAAHREGQLDCQHHGDPRNHAHFIEAVEGVIGEDDPYPDGELTTRNIMDGSIALTRNGLRAEQRQRLRGDRTKH